MNCKFCKNYNEELDDCKFCEFEIDDEKMLKLQNDFDILNLPEGEWEHIQMMDQLNKNNINHYRADIWVDDNIAFIVSCKETDNRKIARVLGIHEECVYNDTENMFVILNLFQEKMIRQGRC